MQQFPALQSLWQLPEPQPITRPAGCRGSTARGERLLSAEPGGHQAARVTLCAQHEGSRKIPLHLRLCVQVRASLRHFAEPRPRKHALALDPTAGLSTKCGCLLCQRTPRPPWPLLMCCSLTIAPPAFGADNIWRRWRVHPGQAARGGYRGSVPGRDKKIAAGEGRARRRRRTARFRAAAPRRSGRPAHHHHAWRELDNTNWKERTCAGSRSSNPSCAAPLPGR